MLEYNIKASLDKKTKNFLFSVNRFFVSSLCLAFSKSNLYIVGEDARDNLYKNQFGKYQK